MSNRIVLTMSLDPCLNPALSPGALRCLTLLRSMAGHNRIFSTLTCSLATQLSRCTNTVRAYRDQLVRAGYIWWTTDPRSGVTRIMIRATVEPPSRRAALAAEGGAQFAAPMKSSRNLSYPVLAVHPRARVFLPNFTQPISQPQEPLRSPSEQIDALPAMVIVAHTAGEARRTAMVAANRASRVL